VPVINALSSYWHPTQVLADLLTLHEIHTFHVDPSMAVPDPRYKNKFHEIRPLTVAYVGDSANVLHDMLVTYPRLGHKLQVASPPQYRPPKAVWDAVTKLGCDAQISWSEDPKAAVKDADVVVTDTWYIPQELPSEFCESLTYLLLGYPWVKKQRPNNA
jgi:ornithine carbamoyltransferase